MTPSTARSFGYDFNGNRTSKTVGAATWTYSYPATSNKLSSITSGAAVNYTHDANGAITSDGTHTFTYDTRGRLVGATTVLGAVTYKVNSLGQRYQKTLQGTTTVYLYDKAGKLIAETADAGLTYTQYVWLADTPVAVIKPTTPDPSLYFIHNDHLDTPRVISDTAQQPVWRWDNDDPFGANMANENPGGLGTFAFNLRFPGQYFDKETNLHYNTYRDYSPEIGRYVQSDPIGLEGGINTYVYGDDPLTEIDPLGLKGTAFSSSSTLPLAPPAATVSSCGQQCNCPDYGTRYSQHLNQYLVNVGPYASALAVGLWPKSFAPATGGRPPLLGSSNPLTSVPRAFGVPGAASTIARGSAAAVGVATVGIGFYNVGTFASGLFYAVPSYCSCQGSTQP